MKTPRTKTKKEELLRKEWEDDVRSRTVTKLLNMLRHPDKYTPECLAFVKEVIIEKLLEGTDPINRRIAQKTTCELFLMTLKEMGCRYEIEEDNDGLICFMYQGEPFTARAYDDTSNVVVYDYKWESVDMKDIDGVSRIRRSVNVANQKSFVSTSYEVDEDNELYVKSWTCFVFPAKVEYRVAYLRSQLNKFFRARRVFTLHMDKLYEEEVG